MPNFVKIGLRGWAGRTPSLSHVLVLPFVCLCILRTASWPYRWTNYDALWLIGRHFENWFNGYISAAMAYICTKFHTGTKNHTPQAILPSKSKMAAAAILKLTLKAITWSLLHIFAQNLAQTLKATSRRQN